ncbi:hypothetical protein, partial [Helicobacter sp. T3_23-1059]
MNITQFIRLIDNSTLRTPIIPCVFFDKFYNSNIGEILKFKGHLRISWSFDIKHNKNIDLIFFPQNNPYINYAVLYAKDFQKSIDGEQLRVFGLPRALDNIKIPYDINYDFVKDILSKAGFSESQQQRFFDMRFGSVLVPLEVEFEWYSITMEQLSFFKYDTFMGFFGNAEFAEFGELDILIGIIKNHSLLTAIPNLEAYNIPWLKDNIEAKNSITKPLPTSALAYTKTNINDFMVNVRDKPDSKNGKIVAQLLSQATNTPNIYKTDFNGLTDGSINPIYQPMFDKGYEWYHKDNPKISPLDGASCYVLYYNFKMLKSYYNTNKQKLINPLFRDNYLVLIWDILPNDWCKVWILKSHNFDIDSFDDKRTIIDKKYKQTFNKTPST